MALKDKLLKSTLKEEKIELNGEVAIVREMTAGKASVYENSLYTVVGKDVKLDTKDAKAKLLCLTLYDEEGTEVFKIKDIEQVKQLPASIVDKVYQIAISINGLDKAKN